jgi:hypothetical protein
MLQRAAHVAQWKGSRTRRHELQRQRQAVYRAAHVCQHGRGRQRVLRCGVHRSQAVDEELDGFGPQYVVGAGVRCGHGQRGDVDAVLGLDGQRSAAGRQHMEIRTARHQLRHVGGCIDHLLEVVEDEQDRPVADVRRGGSDRRSGSHLVDPQGGKND